MPYFKGKSEKLFFACSYDAKNWTALNNNQPVFDAHARLRDPFINRVNFIWYIPKAGIIQLFMIRNLKI